MVQTELTLYTFAASAASEKIRWSLDACGLGYREHRLTPFLHHADNLRISGGLGISIPTLVADGQTIQDSTRILEWLETHRAPFALIPSEPARRTEVMHNEARFDHIGAHVVRCMYGTLLDDPQIVQRLWSLDSGYLQRVLLRTGFPLLRRVLERGMGFEPALQERSRRVIERAMTELDRVAGRARPYLVGDGLSIADVTAAARLAPLACPDQHPLFADPEYRDAIAPLVSRWQARPALAWVREIYRLHRLSRPLQVLTRAPSAAEAFRGAWRMRRPGSAAVPGAAASGVARR